MRTSSLINRNVTIARGRTSIRLEPEFWDALREMADEGETISDVVAKIAAWPRKGTLTSAVHVAALAWVKQQTA